MARLFTSDEERLMFPTMYQLVEAALKGYPGWFRYSYQGTTLTQAEILQKSTEAKRALENMDQDTRAEIQNSKKITDTLLKTLDIQFDNRYSDTIQAVVVTAYVTDTPIKDVVRAMKLEYDETSSFRYSVEQWKSELAVKRVT